MRLIHSILFFAFLLKSVIGFGQLDSLKDALTKAVHDTTKLDLNLQVGWSYIKQQDPEQALIYAEQAEVLAKKIAEPYRAEKVYKLKAFCYGDMNNRPVCLENHLIRIKILESLQNKSRELVAAYFETASVFKSQGQKEAAKEYFTKCQQMAKELQFNTAYALTLMEMSGIKEDEGKIEEAKQNLKLAIKLIKDDQPFYTAIAASDLGHLYIKQDSLDIAEDYLKMALLIVEPRGLNEYSGFVYQGIGLIRLDENKIPEAIRNLTLARKSWEPLEKNFYLQELYYNLAQAFSTVNIDSSNYYYAKHIELSKEVNNSDNNEQIAEMEARFQNDKNQQEILLLSKEGELAALAKNKQEQIFMLVLSGLAIVFFLAIFLLIKLKQNRKQNKLIVAQKLEVQLQKEIVEAKTKELVDSINYAKRIQEAALTDITEFENDFQDSFVLYNAKDDLSGDFYWKGNIVNELGQQLAMIALGDCTGHGVPGALLSILGINYLNMSESADFLKTPAQVLDFLNNGIHSTFSTTDGEFRDGMDMAIVAVNQIEKKLYYACAKNPIYIIREGELIVLKGDKHAVGNDGTSIDPLPFTHHEFDFKPNDLMYLFSDGYPDQFGGEKGKKMGYKNFKKELLVLQHTPLKKQKKILEIKFENWKGPLEQLDDVCVIGVRL